MSPNLEHSKEEVFENDLTQLFTKGFLAVLTSKVAVLKEVKDYIFHGDEQRCKEVNPINIRTGETGTFVWDVSMWTNPWPCHIP